MKPPAVFLPIRHISTAPRFPSWLTELSESSRNLTTTASKNLTQYPPTSLFSFLPPSSLLLLAILGFCRLFSQPLTVFPLSRLMRTVTRLPSRGGATGATARWHPYHASKLTPATTPAPSCSAPVSPTLASHTYLSTPVSARVPSSDDFRRRLFKCSSVSVSTTGTAHPNHKERQDTKKAQKEKFENALKGTLSFSISEA